MEFTAKFAQAFARLGIKNRVLIAVSGGADSVALLRAFEALSKDFSLVLHVAHANHGIREAAAADDSRWVQAQCEQLSIPCTVGEFDMTADQSAIEETARDLRYEFLIRTARETDCSVVAFGHNADDQTETVLHHLMRGTGMAGLRGMPTTRPLAEGIALVRPLLEFTRAEIEQWLVSLNQSWREDSTNQDDSLTRNRIRNQLVPHLREHFNPQISKVMRSLSTQATEWYELIGDLVEPLILKSLVSASDSVVRVRVGELSDQSPIVIRETLVQIWRAANWPMKRMGFSEWVALADLVLGRQPARSLPGNIDARIRGGLLVLTKPDEPSL